MVLSLIAHSVPPALLPLSESSSDGVDLSGTGMGKEVGVGGWGIGLGTGNWECEADTDAVVGVVTGGISDEETGYGGNGKGGAEAYG